MHLLGAAIGQGRDWRTLCDAVSGTVWNYHSANDQVLRWLYRLAEHGQKAVGYAGFGSKFPSIKNRNVSQIVASHSAYTEAVTLQG
jgi:hypothetical protein